MPKTAEDATLPVVQVAGREFPIGPVTLHQIFSLKNLVVEVVLAARARKARREAEITEQAVVNAREQQGNIRSRLAERLGIDAEAIQEAQFLEELGKSIKQSLDQAQMESGYGAGDPVGVILEGAAALNERHLTEIAKLILDRHTHSRVTLEFVEQHFALDWFLEALVLFLEHNHLPSLIKNFSRLGAAISTQMQAATQTTHSSNASLATSPASKGTATAKKSA